MDKTISFYYNKTKLALIFIPTVIAIIICFILIQKNIFQKNPLPFIAMIGLLIFLYHISKCLLRRSAVMSIDRNGITVHISHANTRLDKKFKTKNKKNAFYDWEHISSFLLPKNEIISSHITFINDNINRKMLKEHLEKGIDSIISTYAEKLEENPDEPTEEFIKQFEEMVNRTPSFTDNKESLWVSISITFWNIKPQALMNILTQIQKCPEDKRIMLLQRFQRQI